MRTKTKRTQAPGDHSNEVNDLAAQDWEWAVIDPVLKTGMTAAFAYIRVSTDDQAENFSPATQFKGIQNYARVNGFQIIRVFFDANSGDMPMEARMQGRAMLEALRQKLARVVIVLALDRLSRNEIHAHVIWQSWVRSDIELHFVQSGKQENTAEAKLMFGVTAGVAAYERAKIRERTVRGKRAKVESGRWLGGTETPYGYERSGERATVALQPNSHDADVVRRIFEWYVWGNTDSGPLALRRIATRLNENGEPSPDRRRGASQSAWTLSTLRQILSRELYYGEYVYGKTTVKPKEYDAQPRHQRIIKIPPEQWIKVPMPECAIIEKILWDAAQRRLEQNRIMTNSRRQFTALLSGFLYCATCGRRVLWDAYAQPRKIRNGALLLPAR